VEINSVETNNNKFETLDIGLATFLYLSNTKLVEVIPITSYQSRFIFAKPAQTIIDAWLGGLAVADIRQTLSAYRHLLRESRAKQGAQ